MSKRILLDVDSTIVERNLMITEQHEDELRNLFPAKKEEIPSKLVKPTPGFCIKTRSNTDEKIFINICQTDSIPNPDDISEVQLVEILQSETPSEFRVPMSIGEPHAESDRNGNRANTYDIAIHPTFFKKVEHSQIFKQFLLTVVFEGIQDKFNITINTKNFTILKNKKAMGNLQLHRIQQREINRKMKKEKKLIEEVDIPTTPLVTVLKKDVKVEQNDENNFKEPPYRLSRMVNEESKQFFVGDFYIPDVISTQEINLDVGEDRVILESRKRGYLADFFIPALIDQQKVQAKLNRNLGILTIIMPIVRYA